jgi:D-proline reductase (dithiol) PrdB
MSGTPTVSISLLREVTERVGPPRVLVVDWPLGFPLGAPHDIDLQKRIVMTALELLQRPVQESLLVDFSEGG